MITLEDINKINQSESVLTSDARFYDFVKNELHDVSGIDIYSDEPLGSNYSCFDYNNEGDDNFEKIESDRRYIWKNCKLTKDDDGLYWESESGKNASLLIYAIVKAEADPDHVRLWVAPINSCNQMGVVDFYSDF